MTGPAKAGLPDPGLQKLIERAERASSARPQPDREAAEFEQSIATFATAAQQALRAIRAEMLAARDGRARADAAGRLELLLAAYRKTCPTCGRVIGEVPGSCSGMVAVHAGGGWKSFKPASGARR